MLLIYVPRLTNRLGYIINVIFRTILTTDIEITTDAEAFCSYAGAKLCYAPQRIGQSPWIKSSHLLFDTTIEDQDELLRCFSHNGHTAFFPANGGDPNFPFDIFAASFYLVSRYEEYLPHLSDEHFRYQYTESLAFREGFLDTPIVEVWALELARKIEAEYPSFKFPQRQFSTLITIDIDAAYCYRQKGVLRTMSGFARDAVNKDSKALRQRWNVITKKQDDPFNTFDYILEQTGKFHDVSLIFFTLLADYDKFDKNISYHSLEFRELLQHINDYVKVGIHTSYASYDHPNKIELEIQRLEEILHRRITRNRSHFLRMKLPQTYLNLIENGIAHDYSMGYANRSGFRAGLSCPYPFFDLASNTETTLTIHPFCTMDTALRRHMGLSVDEAWDDTQKIIDQCHAVGGTFCGIWHNENLCEEFGWEGWRSLFTKTLEYQNQLLK